MGQFLKHVLSTLKIRDREILYNTVQLEYVNPSGQKIVEEAAESLGVRFFVKCLQVLNTRAAKNWLKLDTFLDVVACFAIGEGEKNGEDEKENQR